MKVGEVATTPGERITYENLGGFAVIYEIEFVGTGRVEFIVQPGGSFALTAMQGMVNVNTYEALPKGISPL